MDKLKAHITISIALLFLVAQGMSTLHFFTIHHDFSVHSVEGDAVLNTSQVTHHCDFKLIKNPEVTPALNFNEKIYIPVLVRESNFVYNDPLKKRSKNDRYLRGPPLLVG